MTFERFMASLYMTAMMQLGLMQAAGRAAAGRYHRRAADDRHAEPDLAKKPRATSLPPKQTSCRTACTNCAWPTWKSPTRWRGRRSPAPATGTTGTMKATLTVLGSGTSMGVPTLGCDCAVCHSTDPHDRRTRPSIMLEYGGKVVLIDTTPDFYAQAMREKITQAGRRSLHPHARRPHSWASTICAR